MSVNYGQKSLMTLGPGPRIYTHARTYIIGYKNCSIMCIIHNNGLITFNVTVSGIYVQYQSISLQKVCEKFQFVFCQKNETILLNLAHPALFDQGFM